MLKRERAKQNAAHSFLQVKKIASGEVEATEHMKQQCQEFLTRVSEPWWFRHGVLYCVEFDERGPGVWSW